MKKYFIPVFLLAIVSIQFSCGLLKKNVMKDIADDVKEVVISENSGEKFLVVKQEIFQATSKSDNGGIRQITGYNEYRITSYDINSGKISKRIETGDREVNPIFLGETQGKLWYKSSGKELGFHARDPKNLDIIVTQAKVVEVNPFLKDNFSQPEWNNIGRYYGFDPEKNMPMVSDNSGFVYYIDPASLKAEKTTESIKDFKFNNTCISTSMKINANTSINLSGSPRCYITYSGKNLKDISFLKGEFIKSSNMRAPNANAGYLLPFMKEIEKINKEIDSTENFITAFDTTGVKNNSRSFSNNHLEWAKKNLERAKDNLENITDKIKRKSNDDLFDIVTKDNCVFVMSQTDVTDQARVIISKIRINSDTTASQVWQTALKDIYRDPDKGFDKSSFEVVFSKGNPDLRTMRVIEGNDKLIFIFMLRATCIDVQTGNIVWQTDM
ncbi:MAG: PA2928 family protein [Ignavibacteria bacterium]